MTGKITRVVTDGKFFFVDNDYWCHFDKLDGEPSEGDIVEYERKVLNNGKKNAINVKFIKKSSSLSNEYEDEINEGYFNDKDCLKESLIIKFPQTLAVLFAKDPKFNKPTQIRKYYDYCKNLESILKIKKDFHCIISDLLQLIPLTNNAMKKKHISNSFRDFIELNINQAVKSEKYFTEGFLPHFQSIIGYYNIQ